jgi:ubiquitin C-terminal hydrolase
MTHVGLPNLGNTCYLNATLQMLSHCRGFVRCCIASKGASDALSAEMRRIMVAMWSGNAADACPSGLLRAIAGRQLLDVHRQNDAHELLCLLVSELVTPLRAPRPTSPFPPGVDGSWAAALWPLRPDRGEVSPFHGQIAHRTRCTACGDVSFSDDVFTTLSLALARRASTADQLLSAHFDDEVLPGRRCDACKRVCDAVRSSALWRAPAVLVLCFKRFVDPFTVSREPITVTKRLRTAAITAQGSPAAAAHATQRYRVAAVVSHFGSQQGGHYVAAARCVDDTWRVFDDSNVVVLPDGECSAGLRREATYMAAYELLLAANKAYGAPLPR